jgi:outer membrane protein assembly factor BamB
VWCLLLVVGLLVAGSQGVKTAAAKTSSALSMVGGDGYVAWYRDDTTHATVASGTWARARNGFDLSSSGSDALGWWMVTTPLDVSGVDLARFSWASGGNALGATHGDQVFSLDNGEVRLEVFTEGRTSLLYKGGLLELPTAVRAGSTWESAGTTIVVLDGKPGASIPYTSRGTAAAPSDAGLAAAGCLDVTVISAYQDTDVTMLRTWCPGRGLVRFDIEGAMYSAGDPPSKAYSTTRAAFDWTRTNEAKATTRTLVPRGGSLLSLSYVSRPGVLPDGTLVVALKGGNDVVALDPTAATGDLDRTVWRAHPGGVILTCVTLGEVTVATTSERRVIAYGPTGVVLWVVTAPDSVNQPASVLGVQLVVASVDGTVMVLDPATGRTVWRTKMPSELALQPVAVGDTLVVIDENGTTAAFGADGHELWRSTEVPAGVFAISGGVLVVNERGATTMRGYDLATGTKLWRSWEPDIVRSLTDLDGVALAYTPHGVKAFDTATGAVLWSVTEQALDLIVVGDRVVLATAQDLVVLDREGAESARIPHGLSRLPAASVYLAAGTSSVAASTTTELFTEVLP